MAAQQQLVIKTPEEVSRELDPNSLLAKCRTRYLTTIFGSLNQRYPGPKILIVDKSSMALISDVVLTHDLAACDLGLLYDITAHRNPLPNLHAVYFVSPESVPLIVKDFTEAINEPSPAPAPKTPAEAESVQEAPKVYKYKAAHIFLTTGLSNKEITTITTCAPLKGRLLTLSDASIDYFIYESFVGTFKNTSFLPDLFSNKEITPHLTRFVFQLLSVLVTLDYEPVFRYRKNGDLSQRFATHLAQILPGFRERLHWKPQGARATVVILDRGADLITPLMHHFSYTQLVNELFDLVTTKEIQLKDIDADTSTQDPESSEKPIPFILNEYDTVWTRIRSTPMPLLIGGPTGFNAMALSWQNQEDWERIRNKDPRKKEPIAIYRTLANQYARGNRLLSRHLKLFNTIIKHYFEKTGKSLLLKEAYKQLITLENDLACAMCGKMSLDQSSFGFLLGASELNKNDRIRLILIYLLSMSGIAQDKLDEWKDTSGTQAIFDTTLNSLQTLGAGIEIKSSHRPKSSTWDRPRIADRIKDEDVYDVMRYQPLVVDIIQDSFKRRLRESDYPVLEIEEQGRSTKLGRGYSQSSSVSPIIIFVLGGVTPAEMAEVEEIRKQDPSAVPVYLIGTEILTPEIFTNYLKRQ